MPTARSSGVATAHDGRIHLAGDGRLILFTCAQHFCDIEGVK
jgi:hypothetical protein